MNTSSCVRRLPTTGNTALTPAVSRVAIGAWIFCWSEVLPAAKADCFELCQLRATALNGWCYDIFLVSSVASMVSLKHDPDLLKADIALSQNRVSRLSRELAEMKTEMKMNEAGVKSLQQ